METKSGKLIERYKDLIISKYEELGLTESQAISIITYADTAMFFTENQLKYLYFILDLAAADEIAEMLSTDKCASTQ